MVKIHELRLKLVPYSAYSSNSQKNGSPVRDIKFQDNYSSKYLF